MSQPMTLEQWLKILEAAAPDAAQALREDKGLMDNVGAMFHVYQKESRYGGVLLGSFNWETSEKGLTFWRKQHDAIEEYFNVWFGENS